MLRSVPSLAALAPSVSLSSRMLEAARENVGLTVLVVVLGAAVFIVAGWAASKATVNQPEKATWQNALKITLLNLLAVVISFGISVAALRLTENNTAASFATTVFALTMGFAIPMKTYEIVLVRALGWMALTAGYCLLGSLALLFALSGLLKPLTDKLDAAPGEMPAAKTADAPRSQRGPSSPAGPAASPEARPTSAPAAPRAVDEARFSANEKVASDPARPQPERMAALGELYRLLEQERIALPSGDAAARAAFDQRRARYEAILQRMRAEPTPKPKR